MNVLRYGPERSRTPQRIAARHDSGSRLDPRGWGLRRCGLGRHRAAAIGPSRRRWTCTTPGGATGPADRTTSRRTRAPHGADPVRVFDQWGPVGDDRVVDRVPIATQLAGDLGRRCVPTGRPGRSPTGPPDPSSPPVAAHRRDAHPSTIRLAVRIRARTSDACATPTGSADRNTADPPTRRPAGPSPRRASRTGTQAHDSDRDLDIDQQRSTVVFLRRARSPRAANEERAHARRFQFHRGSPAVRTSDIPTFVEPLLRGADPHTPLRSEAPVKSSSARLPC